MNGSNNVCENPTPRPRARRGRCRRSAALVLAALLPSFAVAASGDLPEKPAYQEMLAADRALEAGDLARALTGYQHALTLFEQLRRERPDYKPAALDFRMDYCRQRIAALLAQPGARATTASVPALAAAPTERLRELEAALDQLQKERETAQAELASLREDLRRATARADAADERARKLRSDLDAAIERASALERALAAARESVPSAQHREALAALRAAETERDELCRRAEAAEQQAAQHREQIVSLQARVRELEAATAAAPQEIAARDTQVRETHREAAAAAARAESLAAQLHAAREQIRELKAAERLDADEATERIVALERELKRVAAERAAAATEVEKLRGELERLEVASRDDRERIRELGRALKSAAEPAAGATQELRARLDQAIAERDAAREQAAALQLRLNEFETARRSATSDTATETALAETREHLRRAEARLQALAAKLDLRDREAREAERERDALRAELDRVRAERDRLQEKVVRGALSRPEPLSPTPVPAPAVQAPEPAIEAPAPAALELPPELQQQLAEAATLLSSNQPAAAIRIYDRLLTVAPDHPEALLGYGRAALALGQLRPARAAAERLTSRYPNLAGGHHLRGLVEARDNNLRNAGRAFAKAVALDPTNATYHRDFAIACYKLNRLDDAIAEYREVIRLDPTDGKAHFNLAALLVMQRNPPIEDVRALYRRSLELGEPPDAQLEQRLAQ